MRGYVRRTKFVTDSGVKLLDPRRRRQAERVGEAGSEAQGIAVLALPHPDRLYHHLRVGGDPDAVAAASAVVIPWQHDLGPAVEDRFHRLVTPPAPQRRSLSLEVAHILAGYLCEVAEARQRLVAVRAGRSQACRLDLGLAPLDSG
jgi:hypothetical protein